MRATVTRRDDACEDISFELFATELVGALATLLPEVRAVAREGGLRFGRGSATVELTLQRASAATVVFRQGCERVLGAGVPLSAEGLNDLAADLVGFFCGASLTTLSLFPRTEPVCKPRARPRRRGPYDAPLIPLPFEPPIKLRL
ncbi:MAG TPA: hypothetical protein VHT53_01050 [Candidatus Elarobacter sp.]|jgi:hypothetical protein|nr:hypothetical protein [Candidatus Elarobacter sp.]